MTLSLFDKPETPAPVTKPLTPAVKDCRRVIEHKKGPFRWLAGGVVNREHVIVQTAAGEYRIAFCDDGSDGGRFPWPEEAIERNIRNGMWREVR